MKNDSERLITWQLHSMSGMKFQISQHINDNSGGNLFPIHHIRNIKVTHLRIVENL